jgi:LCP family protein required for cell wall assembly
MSEDWPRGWYANEPGARREPDFKPSAGAHASPYEPTRAMPGGGSGASGPGASGAGRDAWPAQPPSRSGSGGGWQGSTGTRAPRGPRGGRRWLRPKRILLILASLLVVVILAGVGLYFSFNSKLTRVDVLVPTSLTSAGTNWLIAGSDSRGGLTRQEENQLALGHDIGGSRSDTIMLLHMPANGTRPTLVSLPRDSYLPIPGHGYNKLNAAYAFGGPKLLIQTVQNVTGLRVDHFMSIGFGGLVGVVNDVGGVNLCLKAPMKDPKAGLNLKAGCQTLNGAQALGFVRTRAFQQGDLQREQDQRLLLKSLLSKMTSTGTLINPFAVIPAASGAASSVSVDSGTQLYQLVSVAFALRDPVTTTVPFGGFGNTSAGSVVLWNKPKATQFFSDLAHDRTLPRNLISSTSVQGTA